MNQHQFLTEDAKNFGVVPAVILWNFRFWIWKNETNNTNFRDGKFWTYNSLSAFEKQFPYLSQKQIRTALDRLIEVGALEVGNYNKDPRDRTRWYALGGNLHVPISANAFDDEGSALPDNKPSDSHTHTTPLPPKSEPMTPMRIRENWRPSQKVIDEYVQQGLTEDQINDAIADVVDYWRQRTDKASRKKLSGWDRAFRSWVNRNIQSGAIRIDRSRRPRKPVQSVYDLHRTEALNAAEEFASERDRGMAPKDHPAFDFSGEGLHSGSREPAHGDNGARTGSHSNDISRGPGYDDGIPAPGRSISDEIEVEKLPDGSFGIPDMDR